MPGAPTEGRADERAPAGAAGIVVAVAGLAVELRRADAPLAPVALLVGVPIAVVGHGGAPLDAVGTALFLVGVIWLKFGWRRHAGHREGVPA